MFLDIYASNPIPFRLEPLDKVTSNEPPRAAHKSSFHDLSLKNKIFPGNF